MTPQEAHEALMWWRGGVCDHGAAEEALRIVAGQHYEYDYELLVGDEWVPMGYDFATLEYAREFVSGRRRTGPARIVRRLVSESEVAE